MKHKSATQLAGIIGYSKQGVYKLLESGVIKGEKVNGRYWIITEREFNKAVQYVLDRKTNGYKYPFFPSKLSKKSK